MIFSSSNTLKIILIVDHFSHNEFRDHHYPYPEFRYTIPDLVASISADNDSTVYNALGYEFPTAQRILELHVPSSTAVVNMKLNSSGFCGFTLARPQINCLLDLIYAAKSAYFCEQISRMFQNEALRLGRINGTSNGLTAKKP